MKMTKTAPAPVETDPFKALLANLETVAAPEDVFVKAGRPTKISPWLPFLKRSIEGKDADGVGSSYQIPVTYGDSGAISAAMRKAGRDLGVTVQLRWTPNNKIDFDTLLGICNKFAEDTPEGTHARNVRDDEHGKLAFRTIPQVTRNRTVTSSDD